MNEGVVAAGDRHTAAAGAAILRAGGNAVDAAVSAAFVAFVAEPLLASPGGAGMLTYASPSGEVAVVDFFSAVPGLGSSPRAPEDFVEVVIDFGPATQSFHVGRGSVAPPLALPGLIEASRRFGRCSLADLLTLPTEWARSGVPISPQCANVYSLLWPIQQQSASAVALAGGVCPREGQALPNPGLARLFEVVSSTGAAPPELDEALLRDFGEAAGGLLTPLDLEHASPTVCAPRRVPLGSWEALTSPRVGGARVARILESLFSEEPRSLEAAEVVRFAEACRAGHSVDEVAGRGSTTHISVIDGEGGAASLTLTNGEGCGHVIEEWGVQPNNFLGEADLNPAGFHRHAPGDALPTMVGPTIGLSDGRPALALGSGGSNRIRSVVSQVLYRVARGESLEDAVRAPRVHAETDDVWFERGGRAEPDAIAPELAKCFARVHPFEGFAFYFGGAHAVQRVHGELRGVGDARRGGAVARASDAGLP